MQTRAGAPVGRSFVEGLAEDDALLLRPPTSRGSSVCQNAEVATPTMRPLLASARESTSSMAQATRSTRTSASIEASPSREVVNWSFSCALSRGECVASGVVEEGAY